MLLILEIVLAIAAWRRGWKGWALLPLVSAFGFGFLMGLIIGASGASYGGIFAVGAMIDIVCIATLVGMVIKPHKSSAIRPEPVIRTTDLPEAG